MPSLILALLIIVVVGQKPGGPGPTPVPDPKIYPIVASLRGDGLRVAWPDVPGATLACVGRVGGPLLGCGASPWHQGSIDAGLRVRAGETVEVRVWRGLEEVGRGRAVVRWVVYLPAAGTKKPPSG